MTLKHISHEDCIGLIHHSDSAAQYCSQEYVNLLKENNIRISMTENMADVFPIRAGEYKYVMHSLLF